MLTAEQRILKYLAKLSFAAFTEELRTGLAPSSFDQQQHIQRLKQCIKPARLKDTKERSRSW